MDIRPSITIDLEEYGMTGQIVMEPLTFRREVELRNNLGSAVHYEGTGTDMTVVGQDLGDMELYGIMAYITKAPFNCRSKEAVLQFFDRADDAKVGNGHAIYDRMKAEAQRIKDGELSPFGSLESTPTGTTESS